jgi:hypothetical protein
MDPIQELIIETKQTRDCVGRLEQRLEQVLDSTGQVQLTTIHIEDVLAGQVERFENFETRLGHLAFELQMTNLNVSIAIERFRSSVLNDRLVHLENVVFGSKR